MAGFFQMLAQYINIGRWVLIQNVQRQIVSIAASRIFSAATQPDAQKKVANRSDLYASRIFRPRIKTASPTPLVIMVHGGGFIMNLPAVDDPLARLVADKCNCTVVSIDYRKAPRHRFPAAYKDVVDSTLALINDSELWIDKSKVVLCGTSAGANLVLGAAQDPELRGKTLGIVAITPVTDLVPSFEEKMVTRPDPTVPDFLGGMYNQMSDLYTGTTDPTALKDPRLSPVYFQKREDLPKHIFMIGVEHDLLCHETKVMTEKLLGASVPQNVHDADEWQVNNVRWKLIKGQPHAFHVFKAKTPEKEKKRLQDKDTMYQDVAQWIKETCSSI